MGDKVKILGALCKKTAVFSAVILLLVILVVIGFISVCGISENAATEKQRKEFLSELEVVPESTGETVKDVTVPNDFSPVYIRYNELQKRAGYDLTQYKGARATLYTYTVLGSGNTRYFINILTYKGRVIGGDMCSAAIDGEMVPLKKEDIKKCLK